MLPSWLDTDSLRTAAAVTVGVAGALAILAGFLVQRLLFKIVAVLLMLGLSSAAWWYRDDVEACAKTCDCHVFDYDVKMPGCPG